VNLCRQVLSRRHLKIFRLSDINPAADDRAATTASEVPYAEYPLVVLTRDGKKEITRVTPDRNGNYRVELPPGDYILGVEAEIPKRPKPRPFTVVSKEMVRVDVYIDTEIR
jgi:hypothetical protein